MAKPERVIQGATSSLPFSELKIQVEAILFAAESPLTLEDIRNVLGAVSLSDVRLAIKDLNNDYAERAFTIFESGGKFQLRTRDEYCFLLQKLFQEKPRTLSKAALETLAIIAYKQPITRAQINAIRGVDCTSILQSLKEKDLITVVGVRKEVGSPVEYGTTPKFLEVFGLQSLKELPSLRSLQMSRQQQEEIQAALTNLAESETSELTEQDLNFDDESRKS